MSSLHKGHANLLCIVAIRLLFVVYFNQRVLHMPFLLKEIFILNFTGTQAPFTKRHKNTIALTYSDPCVLFLLNFLYSYQFTQFLICSHVNVFCLKCYKVLTKLCLYMSYISSKVQGILVYSILKIMV